ncbi:hypothetical protein F4560_000993 [Saccharothrix ecbatanensis]|uniref:Uncharacterized protein n=2 Tax=Saccharothrix ecbatanensis TaxID=1105145 RepID=A0A7W9HFH5_9PSEU|nr:hypothetical protein [Saccharothrix ecbatanensis]
MVACGRCPGYVCVECGRVAVEEPFMRCERCDEAIETWERFERLRARCAGRRCVSRARAGTSDSDSADSICDSCDEPICWCGAEPVDFYGGWCDHDHGWSDDSEWSEHQDRHNLQRRFDYAVGLIVRLGGGSRRRVFARLHRAMRAKVADADIDQLREGIEHAGDWERKLRANTGRDPV